VALPFRLFSLAAAALLACPAHAGEAAPACHYVEVTELPLRYRGPNLDLTVDGKINGTPAPMMVDTGASETVLTRTGTEKRGLRLHSTGTFSRGIGGTSMIYSARLKDFAAGPAHTDNISLMVIGETGFVPSFDAILGAPFLLQTDLEISLADKVLKFFRPDGCKDAFLGYWESGAIEVPFAYNGDRSPNPHFEVLLNGHKIDAVIDTGSATSVIELAAARRAGLKLDTPGSTRLPDAVGVGTRHAPHWSAVLDTLQIGGETIRGGTIGVMDTKGDLRVDMLLGVDFLRAHRVLFAMQQQKLYLAYLGGQVFTNRTGIEPWIQKEADAGNADAQYALAMMYQAGRGVAPDRAQALTWLEKAAAQGQPQANLLVGRRQMLQGQHAEAATRIKAALDQLPAERIGALWLYIARLQGGEAEQGKRELEATFARSEDDEWPAPIADFYLGRIDAARLLAKAGKDEAAQAHLCQARLFAAELQMARGEKAEAQAMLAAQRAQCGRPAGTRPAPASLPAG
jgi:predicted aspartyl protease